MRRAGASGEILIRADSAFYSGKVIAYLERKGCSCSIAVTRNKRMTERISQIPESAWRPVADYPETGICELAETTYGGRRLIVRRVHLHAQARALPVGPVQRQLGLDGDRLPRSQHGALGRAAGP